MTTTPAAPAPQAGSARTLHLSELLRRPLVRDGESIGRLSDVIVRLRGADYPVVTGLVATVGGREVYVPIEKVGSFDGEAVRLTSAKLDLRSRHQERTVPGAGPVSIRVYSVNGQLVRTLRQQGCQGAQLGIELHTGSRVRLQEGVLAGYQVAARGRNRAGGQSW